MSDAPERDAPDGTLRGALARLADALLGLARTRLELATVEYAEERRRVATEVALLLGGVGCVLFALLFAAGGIVAVFWDSYRIPAIVGVVVFFAVEGAVLFWRRAEIAHTAPTPFGATVAIIDGPRGEWYGIRHAGLEGWASGRFLAAAGGGTVAQPTAQPTPSRAPVSTAPASTAPATGTTSGAGSALATAALKYLGVPYAWGGATPAGWDCSGFVYYIVRQVTGRTLPRTTQAQWGVGTPVTREALQAGDLVFFQNTYEPGITHVGFALGDGRFVHASAPGVGTIISSLADPYYAAHYAGARRV